MRVADCQLPRSVVWRDRLPALGVALCLELGAVSVAGRYPLLGAAWFCAGTAILTVFSMSTGAADAVEMRLTDDAMTSSAAPTTNYGSNGNLQVTGSSNGIAYPTRVFLNFDLSNLPVETHGFDIARAILRLFVDTFRSVLSPLGPPRVVVITGPWASLRPNTAQENF